MNEAAPASVMPTGAVVCVSIVPSVSPAAIRRHTPQPRPSCSMNYADAVKPAAPIPRLRAIGGSFCTL